MPCIWGQHNGSQLFCFVAILPASAPSQLPQGTSYLGPSATVKALIDTGATATAITNRLAVQLQLQPIGKVQIHGVAGVQHHNSYLFRVGFPFTLPPGSSVAGLPPPPPGQRQVQLHVLQKVIQGCEIFAGAMTNFDVLLGMDVISTGSLVVQGNQTFSFSF
jgi:hypothetical protein